MPIHNFHSIEESLRDKIPKLPHIVLERSLSRDIDELVAGALPPMKLAVVDDHFTAQAYGDTVFKALKGRFPTIHVTLGKNLHADDLTADSLRAQTLSCDALVAVGSGTVNDLCKWISAKDKKPYLVFPTAASMNGYLSANASITVKGYKQTLAAQMPSAVFCDMEVIGAAPLRLSQSGLGDSLARPTAQADWLLSHLLLGTAYDSLPFLLLAPYEAELFDNARGVALADPETLGLLMTLQLLSGLGMTVAGGSYPASQGEHMVVHAMEMMRVDKNEKTAALLHGETVGVSTLSMARMQEELLKKRPALLRDAFPEAELTALYGREASTKAKQAFEAKQQASTKADFHHWQDIAEKIRAVHIPSAKLEAILLAAKAPTTPEALGWNVKDYNAAITTARYLRDRFTFLDLA